MPRKRLSGDDLAEHSANRGATGISALNAKANDPTCEHVHHHHDPMAAQEYRFAAKQIDAPQAVLYMPDKAQPGWTIGSCFGSIVFREHAADDVFVDIDAKGTRNLLCDAGTANTGIAALELDDRDWRARELNTKRPGLPVLLSSGYTAQRVIPEPLAEELPSA